MQKNYFFRQEILKWQKNIFYRRKFILYRQEQEQKTSGRNHVLKYI